MHYLSIFIIMIIYMKILFVACYVDNPHFIDMMKQTLDKYLLNCTYDFICLNDAPDINNGEENIVKICDIMTGNKDCYNMILNKCIENKFIHIKIPQEIHNNNRINHGGPRHVENLNWFNQNLQQLVKNYKDYDYLCHIDSDCILRQPIDLSVELAGFDMAGPYIYINEKIYYIHTGLFFINIQKVLNMNQISWNNTMGTDTGSDIANFIRNNPQYKIKKLGHYDGFRANNMKENGHTIISLNINEKYDADCNLIDAWFDKKFIHFRGGSSFAVGCELHRSFTRLELYMIKFNAFLKLL
jgi:hypothetical protein